MRDPSITPVMLSLAWASLIFAGLMEPCWVIGMKMSRGFRHLKWTFTTLLFLLASMYFLSLAIDLGLPVGTAYAVWTGIGSAGALVAGVVLFKEKVALMKIAFVLLMVIGIAGLQLTAGA